MKTITSFIILLLAFSTITFSQSVLESQPGTGIEIQAGADVCADDININGTYAGGGTICGAAAYLFNLTAFIEGFYNSSTNFMITDTATVYLRNNSSPYNTIDSSKGILSSSGTETFLFANAVNGESYFLEVRHRNSIATWSSVPIIFISGSSNYDFAVVPTQAYGSNEIQVDTSPLRYAIYGGDVNQDGLVNLNDILLTSNNSSNFISGYVNTDLNGDNNTNLSDILIAYNNSNTFVSVMRP